MMIGHSPGPGGGGGYLNSDAHHVLGLKIRKINILCIHRSWSYVLGCKKFLGFFRVNRIISFFDIKSS